jgi:hypothetical protein
MVSPRAQSAGNQELDSLNPCETNSLGIPQPNRKCLTTEKSDHSAFPLPDPSLLPNLARALSTLHDSSVLHAYEEEALVLGCEGILRGRKAGFLQLNSAWSCRHPQTCSFTAFLQSGEVTARVSVQRHLIPQMAFMVWSLK